jgi:hypothetical protein
MAPDGPAHRERAVGDFEQALLSRLQQIFQINIQIIFFCFHYMKGYVEFEGSSDRGMRFHQPWSTSFYPKLLSGYQGRRQVELEGVTSLTELEDMKRPMGATFYSL